MKYKGKAILFYWCFLIIITINYSLQGTLISNPLRCFNIAVALVCSVFCIFLKKYSRAKLVSVFFIYLFGLVNYLITGYTDFLMLILAVFMADEIDVDKLLNILFFERLLIFSAANIGALIGILPITVEQINKHINIVTAYAPGYAGANTYSCQVGILLLLYLARKRKNINIMHFLVIIGAESITYMITRSRTGLFLIVLTLFGIFILNEFGNRKLLQWICRNSYILFVLCLFGIIFAFKKVGYGNLVLDVLNDVLFNGRIGLSTMYLTTYQVPLLGKNLDMTMISSNAYYALDNGYVVLLFYYGIVGFALYSFIMIKVLRTLLKKKEMILVVICMVTMIWSAYEAQMISLAGNFVILLSQSPKIKKK